jgi:hypothetical protein
VWTAHLRGGAPPVLVREGWSWGALFFGPLWFASHRAWIPAALDLAALVLAGAVAGGPVRVAVVAALVVGQGLFGRDLLRWSLDFRGYTLAHVLVARDGEAALARLLHRRPDLIGAFLPPGELP